MLLTENRVSKVKEMYNIPSEVWEPMVTGSAAISPNQKYLEWIAKQWEGATLSPEDTVTRNYVGGTIHG